MPVEAGARTIDMDWSYPKYLTFQRIQRPFVDVAMHLTEAVTVGGPDGAERVVGELVSAHYLPLLGVRPSRGRFFLDGEDGPTGGIRSVVIGDGMWRARFGGDANILGRTMQINGNLYTVILNCPPAAAHRPPPSVVCPPSSVQPSPC